MKRLIGQILHAAINSGSYRSCNDSGKFFCTGLCGSTKLRDSGLGSSRNVLEVPWLALQQRGVKITGTDVKLGNIIERKGRLYEVVKAQHTQHGRGGATIQVELRDVESGIKITERLRTSEAIERIQVEDKAFTFLYEDGDSVLVMEPNTFEQVQLSKAIFGRGAAYLTDGMSVTLQFYDGKPLSATVPHRATCTVVEAEPSFKGQTITPQYKKVVLDNGRTVMAPAFVGVGDKIVVNTTDDSYMTSDESGSMALDANKAGGQEGY